jgi:hypothetical protein
MRTECLIDPGVSPRLSVRIRCLQSQHRTVEAAGPGDGPAGQFLPVDFLEIDGTIHVAWDEALDQVVDVAPLSIPFDGITEHDHLFSFPGGHDTEVLENQDGSVVGRFVRSRELVEGAARIRVSQPDPAVPFLKVSVTVENATWWTGVGVHRDDALGQSLIAVHTMLAVDDGTFISLLDPPARAAEAVRSCRSEGIYPVLIGDDDIVLSSPIILYDHPEVAPQSPGDLYDSLEIDEILALRVMTLTDEEKSEARGTDARAAAIIDRCDEMSAETLSQLHGQMRPVAPTSDATSGEVPWWDPEIDASFDPWTESVWIAGVEITQGSRVQLRPSHRADAHDIFLAGLAATVAGVFTDVDGDQHVAVTVDDDPATEALSWQGRYLFFHPDEVVPRVDQDQLQ